MTTRSKVPTAPLEGSNHLLRVPFKNNPVKTKFQSKKCSSSCNQQLQSFHWWCFLIFSTKATFTSPFELRAINPIPASSDSPNIAPSKLIFQLSRAGGLHLLRKALQTGEDLWNRDLQPRRYSRAKPVILSNSMVFSFNWVLFLWYHTDHAIVANRATFSSFVKTSSTRFLNEVKTNPVLKI